MHNQLLAVLLTGLWQGSEQKCLDKEIASPYLPHPPNLNKYMHTLFQRIHCSRATNMTFCLTWFAFLGCMIRQQFSFHKYCCLWKASIKYFWPVSHIHSYTSLSLVLTNLLFCNLRNYMLVYLFSSILMWGILSSAFKQNVFFYSRDPLYL